MSSAGLMLSLFCFWGALGFCIALTCSSQSENGLFSSLCPIGNMDRHHYETFEKFGNETFIIHLDNGRG